MMRCTKQFPVPRTIVLEWGYRTAPRPAADTPSIPSTSPSTAACRDPLSGYYDIVFCTTHCSSAPSSQRVSGLIVVRQPRGFLSLSFLTRQSYQGSRRQTSGPSCRPSGTMAPLLRGFPGLSCADRKLELQSPVSLVLLGHPFVFSPGQGCPRRTFMMLVGTSRAFPAHCRSVGGRPPAAVSPVHTTPSLAHPQLR